MKKSARALGNATRQANKKLRRESIFNIAKRLIATNGLDDFTISQLAREAGVTTPTIHNLFGKKSDIVKELVAVLIEKMKLNIVEAPSDPIENTKFYVGRMVMAYEQDEEFYRAAFIAAEQVRLFDPKINGGLFQRAQKLAAPRTEWYESGLLLGNVEPEVIMRKVHNSNRLGRLDWAVGYIDLAQYRHQVSESIFLAYACDASPELHARLIEEINRLDR